MSILMFFISICSVVEYFNNEEATVAKSCFIKCGFEGEIKLVSGSNELAIFVLG